jgi:hypothetical protein
LLCCRRVVYGSNEMIVPIYGIVTLLFLEVLNPFYVFQLLSFCLWFADDYMYYALAILTMSVFGIVMAVLQTRRVSWGHNVLYSAHHKLHTVLVRVLQIWLQTCVALRSITVSFVCLLWCRQNRAVLQLWYLIS